MHGFQQEVFEALHKLTGEVATGRYNTGDDLDIGALGEDLLRDVPALADCYADVE